MADSLKDSVLAVDGGGTRRRFALERRGERVVTEAGSANALTDFDTTQRCLLEGLQSLAQIASTRAEALHDLPAFVGLAHKVTLFAADGDPSATAILQAGPITRRSFQATCGQALPNRSESRLTAPSPLHRTWR